MFMAINMDLSSTTLTMDEGKSKNKANSFRKNSRRLNGYEKELSDD